MKNHPLLLSILLFLGIFFLASAFGSILTKFFTIKLHDTTLVVLMIPSIVKLKALFSYLVYGLVTGNLLPKNAWKETVSVVVLGLTIKNLIYFYSLYFGSRVFFSNAPWIDILTLRDFYLQLPYLIPFIVLVEIVFAGVMVYLSFLAGNLIFKKQANFS